VSWFPAAFRPPAFASRSSDSRRGVGPSSRSAYRARSSGPRRGYHVPHARAATGKGALWTPGTTVLTPTEATTGRAPAASQRPVPAPRRTSHRQGSRLTRHQRGFKQFARPIFPSPVAARMERAALGLEPRASHPADQEPDSARQGGDRSSSTDLELHAQLTSVDLQSSSSLNACDLASHVARAFVRPRAHGWVPVWQRESRGTASLRMRRKRPSGRGEWPRDAAMSSAWRDSLKLRASTGGRRRSTIAAHADATNAKGGTDARLQDWDP
jgi:hypothetical protein